MNNRLFSQNENGKLLNESLLNNYFTSERLLLPAACATSQELADTAGSSPTSAFFCRRCGVEHYSKRRKFCAGCGLTVCLDDLFAKKKLILEAWRHFRLTFSMPDNPGELTVRKARFLRHLLEYFVARHTLAEQLVLTQGKLFAWMQIDLPDQQRKSLEMFGFEKFDSVITSRKKSKTKTTPVHSKAASKKKAKRKQLSNTKFMEVAARQGCFCFWCGIKVIRQAAIPADNRIISCRSCNLERDEKTKSYGRPFARRKLPCHNCGGRFFHPDWGCCSICGAIPNHSPKKTRTLVKTIKQKLQSYLRF